jgi:hypothetical protein
MQQVSKKKLYVDGIVYFTDPYSAQDRINIFFASYPFHRKKIGKMRYENYITLHICIYI